ESSSAASEPKDEKAVVVKPPPPPSSNATYTIRLCNRSSDTSAWVTVVAYLTQNQNPWQKGWWRVAAGQCLDALTLNFGARQSRTFWVHAEFDDSTYWPAKQELDPRETQAVWCAPAAGQDFQIEIIMGELSIGQPNGYQCRKARGEKPRFFAEYEAPRS